MKVKIMQRSVYYKYAEIEVEVPKDVDVQDWLIDNEDKWADKMQESLDFADLDNGMGMNTYDWTDKDESWECMYLCSDGFGGHI